MEIEYEDFMWIKRIVDFVKNETIYAIIRGLDVAEYLLGNVSEYIEEHYWRDIMMYSRYYDYDKNAINLSLLIKRSNIRFRIIVEISDLTRENVEEKIKIVIE